MKKFILLWVLFICYHFTDAQSVYAEYEIKKIVNVPTVENPDAFISLDGKAYYYREGEKSIFFTKPDYLKKYTDGMYEYQSDGSTSFLHLSTDSLQFITYANFDSLLIRYRVDASFDVGSNMYCYYQPNSRAWQIHDTVRIINGLECKYATTKSRSGDILSDIWFYPEIEMPVAIHRLTDVPGLIVEGNYYNTKESFKLTNFQLDLPIAAETFWPKYFDEPFKKIPDMKTLKP